MRYNFNSGQAVRELLLALACFIYACVRGTARRKISEHKKMRIVVIQFAKLGDMVCTTPLFRAVKKKYPDAHLTVVGDAINKELLKHNKDVDEYVVFLGIWPLVRHLRRFSYDFGCTATPSMAALSAMFLGGVGVIAVPRVENGTSPLETISYRLTRVLVLKRPHRMWHYACGEYLRLLEPLHIQTENIQKHLGFSEQAKRRAEELYATLDQNLLWIGISPSSGFKPKNWGSKKFAALAQRLASDLPAAIIVFGGERDTEETKTMLADLSNNIPVLDFSGKLSIDELKATISLLDLFIAPDTGPIYIAEAFDVPSVDILGAAPEQEVGPRGPIHALVVPPGPRVAELHVMNPRRFNAAEAARQTEAITIDRAYQACRELLQKLGA